jgi:hypothetical protein
MHSDISLFISSLNKAGIVASRNPIESTKKAVYCNYRNNPDGSIRWIWPVESKKADFLKFYHRSGLKPRVFATAANLLSRIGLSGVLSDDSFFFYINDDNYSLIKYAWDSRWAWFSGTIGPNRKSILWRYDKNHGSGTFIKIPFGPQAEENLRTEAEQLQRLQQMQLKNIVLPSEQMTGNGCLQLTEIGECSKRTNRFSAIPFNTAIEWMQAGLKKHHYETSTFARDLGNMLLQLRSLDDARISPDTLGKLKMLIKKSCPPAMLITTLAHGDFTPWNIMVKNNQLCCIDLELSRNHMPVLFDLFHFVYQSNIMIGNKGYKSIRQELDQLFALPQWQTFINEHGIDIEMAEKQYLLYTMAYYLEVYHRQPQWHIQVSWLLKTWDEALSWHLANGIVPARNLLLKDLGVLLKDKRYAVLKWTHQRLETLPLGADIDICINHTDAKKVLHQLNNHVLVTGIQIQKRSFMMQLEIMLYDGSVLHLDLISKFKRKSLVFMDAAEVLANAGENRYGLKTASIEDNFAYTWMFNWLNNNDMPQRYQLFFGELGIKSGANLNIMLWRKYGLPIGSYEDVFLQNEPLKEQLLKVLAANSENKGLRRLWNQFEYLVDTVTNLFPGRGVIITFSGVDGTGKSTVIANIRELMDKQLRRKVIALKRYQKHGARVLNNDIETFIPSRSS